VDVALHRREDDLPLLRTGHLLHELFEVRDRGLHHLRTLQHEGQLHLARAEEVADHLHAVEENLVDDVERRVSFAGEVEVRD
jgi:hypothetical protein